jgi:hypothetical protein
LQPGFHILYAYAGDGQEATSEQPGSPLIGAIAAYGFLVNPALPPVTVFSPAQDATGVALTTLLTWGAVSGAVSYDVYFGTSPSPPFATNTTGTSFSPAALIPSTTYYWYLVSHSAAGSTASTILSFTTAPFGHPSFFAGEIALNSTVYYLQFPNGNTFGYYAYLSNTIVYHFDMGYEAIVDGPPSAAYLYDFLSGTGFIPARPCFPTSTISRLIRGFIISSIPKSRGTIRPIPVISRISARAPSSRCDVSADRGQAGLLPS